MARETRKCGTCGNSIIVNRQNIDNVAFYQGYHHHVGCLIEKANKGVESGKRVANWERLLNRIPELQAESKRRLWHSVVQDEFNDYLLEHYDVFAVSNRFWNIVGELGLGSYKRQKCKPVDMDTIFQTWKWGQKNLDKIAANNKANNKGPSNDEQRLNYDLAIVLKHIGDYKNAQEKKEMNIQEVRRNVSFNEIDTSKIGQKKTEKKEDVSDIFDDFFS